jgi:hypothetical protein
MAKRSATRVRRNVAKETDQYLLRLPAGLRDQVADRAAQNGRSLNAEVVDAITRHLASADRVTQLWEFFEQYRIYIELIPILLNAVQSLERCASASEAGGPSVLSHWMDKYGGVLGTGRRR